MLCMHQISKVQTIQSLVSLHTLPSSVRREQLNVLPGAISLPSFIHLMWTPNFSLQWNNIKINNASSITEEKKLKERYYSSLSFLSYFKKLWEAIQSQGKRFRDNTFFKFIQEFVHHSCVLILVLTFNHQLKAALLIRGVFLK